jgi:hypothetical protein
MRLSEHGLWVVPSNHLVETATLIEKGLAVVFCQLNHHLHASLVLGGQ